MGINSIIVHYLNKLIRDHKMSPSIPLSLIGCYNEYDFSPMELMFSRLQGAEREKVIQIIEKYDCLTDEGRQAAMEQVAIISRLDVGNKDK